MCRYLAHILRDRRSTPPQKHHIFSAKTSHCKECSEMTRKHLRTPGRGHAHEDVDASESLLTSLQRPLFTMIPVGAHSDSDTQKSYRHSDAQSMIRASEIPNFQIQHLSKRESASRPQVLGRKYFSQTSSPTLLAASNQSGPSPKI